MNTQDHEKLFDEICSKLNELSHREDSLAPQSQKIERMQTQIRRFQDELQGAHEELRSKIRSIETMQIAQPDLNDQLKALSDQLQNERTINTKLNSDLAKSLELSLQLQLEIQSLKARAAQMQSEEKKYSLGLQEKLKLVSRDLELANALRDETVLELNKAKANFQNEHDRWELEKKTFEQQLNHLQSQKDDLLKANQDLIEALTKKDLEITELTHQIENLSQSLNGIENSAQEQQNVLKNLMDVAENKIIEMKLALDKKTLEGQDYYGHLQQALTQVALLKQENLQLKDYINKVSVYFQTQAHIHAQTQGQTQIQG